MTGQAPTLPAGFTAPTPPPSAPAAPQQTTLLQQPAAPAAPPPAPPAPVAPPPQAAPDLTAQIRDEIKAKAYYDGNPLQAPEQIDWALNLLTNVFGDQQRVYFFIHNSSAIDLKNVHENPAAYSALGEPSPDERPVDESTAPANPISDDTSAPQATMEQPAAPSIADTGAAPASVAPPADGHAAPTDPEQLAAFDRISGEQCKSVRGLKSRLTKTHKMDWKDYCNQFGLDHTTGLPAGETPADQPPVNEVPTSAPPPAPGMPTQANPDGTMTSVPPAPPQEQAQPAVPADVPMFTPGATNPPPQPAQPPQAPAQPAAAPQQSAPIPFDQHTDPAVQAAGQIVTMAAQIPGAPTMTQQPAAQPAPQPAPQPQAPAATNAVRAEMAKLLGGEVSCVFVPLLEVGSINLADRVDVNQLQGIAEAEALRQITDPEDLKYRKDRQVAAQIFSQMLTQYPQVYCLMNGYDMMLSDNLFNALAQRLTHGVVVRNGKATDITFS